MQALTTPIIIMMVTKRNNAGGTEKKKHLCGRHAPTKRSQRMMESSYKVLNVCRNRKKLNN